ncbi:MAG: response regulator [Clostridiales Family XIII bacterium]|jgi:signal transduction histidine kinase/CheY-like chemotaxis protein|nr:response regulator [Clostridiales Family XIII bacterium]
MKIRNQDVKYLATIAIISVLALVLGCLLTFDLGALGNIVVCIVGVLAIGTILFSVSNVLKKLRSDAYVIEEFIALASAGHLDKRIDAPDTNAFYSMTYDLNTMMENFDQMSKSKSDFLSSMSHEIRTPMNAIVGMSQLARMSGDPVKMEECINKIEENSTHLLGIINDILDFSKIEAGKLILDEQLFSLRRDIDFVVDMFYDKAKAKGIHFSVDITNVKNDGIVTDSLRLNQVLINLLSNAIKFTNKDGHVDLTIREIFTMKGESVYSFSVEDTGIGITIEQASRLFTPFAQADSSTTKHYGGTGLGLVISKNIVEIMGGEIELDSRPGIGSTFSFTIRTQSQEAVPSSISSATDIQSPDLTQAHLLIVDDVEINREIACAMLESTGAQLDTARDGQEAFDLYLNSPTYYYDLILMDMQMPDVDGCEATELIRGCGRLDAKTIKIVAMTANVMKEDIQKAYDSGMDNYISKPIDFTTAYHVISEMLQQQKQMKKQEQMA